MVKLFKIEKELREKRRSRLHKQGIVDARASPVGQTQPVVPLSRRLATPEVPLSHVRDPPGVNQLNPMSIWNIQNSPASLDLPAASAVSPPAQIHDEETALAGQDPGSPLSYSANTVPTVPPLPHQALPGFQSQSTSLGQMGGATHALAPGRLPSPEPPPPCLKSAQGPGTLGEPHIGTRDAGSHGLLGKRRRLAEGGWRASPAGPSPSALPDAPAQPSPVTLASLCRSLEDLRISVLRNLGAVHRQVEALEKRIHLLERWRAETEGRQQPQQP